MTASTVRECSQGRSAALARTGGNRNRDPASNTCALRLRGSAKQGLPHWDWQREFVPTGSFCNHLHTDRVRDACNNGILHLQELGPVLVKLVSPEMRTALGIDELGMH